MVTFYVNDSLAFVCNDRYYMNTTEKISRLIKSLRESRDMTQQQLANALSVSRVAVTKWESGQTLNLRIDNIVGICKLFNISADDFLQGNAEPPEGSRNRPAADALFGADIVDRFTGLKSEGRAMVITQMSIAIETATRMYGTRINQTA